MIHLFRKNTPKYFDPIEERELVHYLEHHAGQYYVLQSGNEVIGGGGINMADDLTSARISLDILDPGNQGKGLGSLLLNFRIEQIKAVKSVRSITVRTSQLVYPFYEKAGFKLEEIVRDYWAPGFDLYRMQYFMS